MKRRFIRQNREIARVNSTQSLRIRNLEAEISRLLAENITLREQAINSAQEAERLRSSHRVFKEVSKLKEQLESKLSEVSSLVTELGSLPEKAKRRSSQLQRRKSGLVEIVRSPEPKDWKNRQTFGGVVAGERQIQDGRLPVIVEGKHYPRKTLESLEISRIVDGDTAASESPEIGPPPVAHFDVAEPIDYAPAPARAGGCAQREDDDQDGEDNVKPLPGNLERRRKRRASALLEDMPALNTSSTDVSNAADDNMPLKSGAKRKLDSRDDAYKEQSCPSELDDFSFQRKTTTSDTPQTRPRGSRFTKPGTTSATSNTSAKVSGAKLEPASRKILAPKSTNSPSKSKRRAVNDKIGFTKDATEDKARIRDPVDHKKAIATVNSSTLAQPSKVENIVLPQEPDRTDLPPKTPAGLDLFSPVSTSSSARVEQQPEIALTASVEDVLGGTDGRASRRARGAVSYAEPSLRAKMRRPTKELVAAVGEQTNGFKALERESSARAESQERQASEDSSVAKMRIVAIKREKPEDDEAVAWKGLAQANDEPPSPLVNKVAKPSSKRASETPSTVTGDPGTGQSATTQQLESALENLSIFDGPDSSPHDPPPDTDAVSTIQSRKTSSGRHSSNPAGLRRVGQDFEKSQIPDRPNSKTALPPRPSSAASLRKDRDNSNTNNGTSGRNENDKVDNLKRSASVTTMRSKDGGGIGLGAEGDGSSGGVMTAAAGRSERAAARRRSMMI